MPDLVHKRAIIAALSHSPDFSLLTTIPPIETREGRSLLGWLDKSGVALVFRNRLQEFGELSRIPAAWRLSLEQRLASNGERTRDILAEFQRINTSFDHAGVSAIALKGFTLIPDFCGDASLRHQSDLDFLVAPGNVKAAAKALQTLGYSANLLNDSGETCFTTPLRHVPSPDDSLYALQRHRQVDLHVSLWEDSPWISLQPPADCLERAEPHSFQGINHHRLALEDRFLFQVLHVFRHALRSWIRVSWLFEIARCIEIHKADADLWNRVIGRAGNANLMKSAFAYMLGLCQRMFQTPIPLPMQHWTAPASSAPLRTWLDRFAVDWALADWPGSLDNLLLTPEFIPNDAQKIEYWRSRLFPGPTQMSLGNVTHGHKRKFLRLQFSRAKYISRRSAAHLKDILGLPAQQIRWARALKARQREFQDSHS
jgi:Uncharacterised nucleotidyltransferase